MVKIDTKKITEIAELFKNADPQLYEKFLRYLDCYVEEVTVAVTEAPSSEILQAQGRAQMARKFFKLFSEFPSGSTPPPSPPKP